MKIKAPIAALSCLLLGMADGLQAPCYGYGEIMGEPSKYMADDIAKVIELNVGKRFGDEEYPNVYVSNINYLFEGKNFLQIGYMKKTD